MWKFEPGQQPVLKTSISMGWMPSSFPDLDAFLDDPHPVEEISAEEAEPVSG